MVQSSAIDSDTLMRLINEERESRNLTVLTIHPSLLVAANEKSQDMIDRDYFAHVDPDGNYVWPRIAKAGYGAYKILGENLALDFLTSEGMVKAWLDSPKHRDNLLHTDFLEQGLVALYGDYQGRYTNLTTSLFGARQNPTPLSPPAVKPSPEPLPPKTPPPTPPAPEPLSISPTPLPAPVEVEVLPESSGLEATPTFATTLPVDNARKINFWNRYNASKIFFTLLAIALLGALSADAVIIHRNKNAAVLARSYSSYHLFTVFIVVLLSILVWWW